jgi:hypothetical protein
VSRSIRRSATDRAPAVTWALLLSLAASPAFAADTGAPWETPIQGIVDSLTGPIVRVCGKNTPIPFNGALQRAAVPSVDEIAAGIEAALATASGPVR